MSSNNVKKKFYEDMQSFYDQQDKYNFLEPYKDILKALEETVANSLLKYREELQDELRFPNGWNTVNPWDEIARRWNDVLGATITVSNKQG